MLAEPALEHTMIYLRHILQLGVLLTGIQGAEPCILLLQDRLEEMHSSRPFGEDATPLLPLLLEEFTQS